MIYKNLSLVDYFLKGTVLLTSCLTSQMGWNNMVSTWYSRQQSSRPDEQESSITEFFEMSNGQRAGHHPLDDQSFRKTVEGMYNFQRLPRSSRTHWAAFACDREKWAIYCHTLESLDDQRSDKWCRWCGFYSGRVIVHLDHSQEFWISFVNHKVCFCCGHTTFFVQSMGKGF